MKTFLLTIAALSTLVASAAFAASTSNSEGKVHLFYPHEQVALQNGALDPEPTASIGVALTNEIFNSSQRINDRDASVRYTFDGGKQTIIAKTFRTIDH